MPLDAQVKLLRVLQDGFIDPVGGSKPVPGRRTDHRGDQCRFGGGDRAGRFPCSDLFYRLNVFPLYLPPLRERPEDILFARHFLREHARRLKRCCGDFEPESMDRLVQYGWPGNVRELENRRTRLILCHERLLRVDPAMLGLRPAGHTLVARHCSKTRNAGTFFALTIADWKIEGQKAPRLTWDSPGYAAQSHAQLSDPPLSRLSSKFDRFVILLGGFPTFSAFLFLVSISTPRSPSRGAHPRYAAVARGRFPGDVPWTDDRVEPGVGCRKPTQVFSSA
ncbi:MAG: hypothetical protein U0361_20585 [Nitrospiraceae bacterium]